MIGETSDSTRANLIELLNRWIDADTWEQSLEILNANSAPLLSDEALQALNDALAESESEEERDEDWIRILQVHKDILEKARAESIEAAYADLLKPSPLAQALQELPDELRDAIQAMMDTTNSAELIKQVERHPILLTPQAAASIDTLLEALRQAGQQKTVDIISERYETLKQLIEVSQDPLNIALNALMQAPASRLQETVAQYPILLEEETLHAINEIISRTEQAGDTVTARRLRLRIDEVLRIRDKRVQPVRREPAGEAGHTGYEDREPAAEIHAEDHSMAARDNYGTMSQTNIENLELPPQKWQQPADPSLPRTFVGRQQLLQELRDYLLAGESVAISGSPTTTMLQGMGGIGKTYLATRLAIDVKHFFPGGVITIALGERITGEEEAQDKLRELASYAFAGQVIQFVGRLQPQQVRAWLQGMAPGRLLVIFDDVWSREPLLFLESALPTDAVRIITTRDANISHALSGKHISLDRLSNEDGIALLEDRLGCRGETAYRSDLAVLVTLLEGHALALDIIAARIKQPRRLPSILDALNQGIGQARLDQLTLRGKQTRESSLEKSLALSYDYMTGEEQRRFRTLGVFEAETPITAEAAASVWGLDDLNAAEIALNDLLDLAMLEKSGETFRQHGLLNVYAIALLEKEDELNRAMWAHAEYYYNLALRAETTTPKDYPLLDRHMQNLRRALNWTDNYEPLLFSQLVEVLFQFLQLRGESRKLEEYLPKAIAIATSTGDTGRQANTLQSLGDLESRLGHVDEARAHYDAALPLYQTERARLGEANTLQSLGDLESRLGHVDEARAHYDAALPLYQAERARLGEANVYLSLAILFLSLQQWEQARRYYEQASPLFIAEREPLGQANTLFGLGRALFESGEHEQGIHDVEQAVVLFRAVRDEEWARRAEQILTEMQRSLQQPGVDAALFQAFVAVQSPREMFELVQHHPQLLTDAWFAAVETLMAAQEDEQMKEAFSQRLQTLKEIRKTLEENAVEASKAADKVIAFVRADWNTRRQMLIDPSDALLSETIEPVFEMFLSANKSPDARQALEAARILLRRCRSWGVDAAFYFSLRMRLGDDIDIPVEYEPTLMQVATLLSQQDEDDAARTQAIQAMETLLNRLTATVPPLFEAALLRDLAETLQALPSKHPLRDPVRIETYLQEALPLYQAADRPVSVAFIRRSIGDALNEQGRFAESLAYFEDAIKGLLAQEHTRNDAAWACSACADALDNLGRTEEAVAAYTQALTLLPDSPPLLRNRAEALINARRLNEAEADLARAVELDGNENSSYLWFRRAQLAVAHGDGLLADQMLDEVLKRKPAEDVVFMRAQSSWLRGDLQAAREALRHAFSEANAGQQLAMRRELQLLFAEHPDLPAITDEDFP